MKSTFLFSSLVLAGSSFTIDIKELQNGANNNKLDYSKCLRGGMKEWVSVAADKVPPCWIKVNGKFDCYEYKTDKKCDSWPGMFDINSKDGDKDCDDNNGSTNVIPPQKPTNITSADKLDYTKCLRGGMKEWVGVTDAKVPPCWIEVNGKFDCYEYKTGNQCDNWPGMFDINSKDGKNDCDDTLDIKPNKAPAEWCDKSNIGTRCNLKDNNCPPCWKKNGDKFDCYVKIDNKCPWSDMIDISQ